jgi:carboxyl-terminal processing protease
MRKSFYFIKVIGEEAKLLIKLRLSWSAAGLLAALVLLFVAISCGPDRTASSGSNANLDGLPSEFGRLAEVWQLLKREHYDGDMLNAQAMSEGAIRGMLQALEDPYASFLSAEQYSLQNQDTKGFFEGIGAEVGMRDGRVTILAPIPDTPADLAGIKPGDVILEIDGESAVGITLLEAISKIRGPKGTTVTLMVAHLNAMEPAEIVIERGVIELDSVRYLMMVGRIGHLRITSFTETTNQELQEALSKFNSQGGVGLILDLRNNPGGLLSSVIEVTSQFLSDGLVLYEQDSKGRRVNWEVRSGGIGQTIPMVVLVNEFSASASEVLAGAIIDHSRAQVVGTTTYGKGSVNTLRQLSDNSGVYFTIARWFTPNGMLIEGEGIIPDVVVETSPDDDENVLLDAAIEILQQQLKSDR